jgi:uncharacterized membrane protein YkoI
MGRSRLFAGGAALLLSVAAAGAFAFPGSLHVHRASQTDLAAARGGQGSLNRAIAAAENLTGSKVIEIHYVGGDGPGHYEATLTRNGMFDHAVVNAATGQVALADQSRSARTFEYKQRAESELVVRGAKVGLKEAVANAEQASRGIAISAGTTRSGDGYMVAHDIETVRADLVRAFLVDAKTGQVIADPQAFAGER